jgi:hypothetical protein
MFRKSIAFLVVCCLLMLSACAKPTPTPDTQATVNALYTSVVQTLAVSMPTVTPQPSMTPSPTASITPLVTNTLAATPTLKATLPLCDNSVFVSDVTIPDHTVMSPGQAFTKTWSIKNVGTCAWTTSYKVAFLSGTSMGGVSTAIPAVAPGRAENISVNLVAPITKGTYTGYWILQNANGQSFGASFYVIIDVSTSVTATTTGTITPTPDVLGTSVAGTLTAIAPTATTTDTP